jgi:hypothetical protein
LGEKLPQKHFLRKIARKTREMRAEHIKDGSLHRDARVCCLLQIPYLPTLGAENGIA